MNQKPLEKEELKEVGVLATIHLGIFGELEDCDGVEEKRIEPEEGGTLIKLVGCTALFKGDATAHRVNQMRLAKSMVSNIPRVVIGRSKLISAAYALQFLFFRRKFLNAAHFYIEEIIKKSVAYVAQPYIRYNKFEKEIMRAMGVALRKEYGIQADFDLMNASTHLNQRSPILAAVVIYKFVSFLCVLLAFDAAYRLRVQDGFGEVNDWWQLRYGDVRKEILRVADIVVEREQAIKDKFKFFRNVLSLLLLVSPRARRIARNFLLELDIDKVVLDDHDWYFCLRRPSYNFRGMPIWQRLEEAVRIDKEKDHWKVQLIYEDPKTHGTQH